ncbi:MAG: hypothetical protein V7744_00250 [Pseudomonadales bacterium]
MFARAVVVMLAVLFASQTIAAAFDSHSSHQKPDTNRSLSHLDLDESHHSHVEGSLASSDAADENGQQDAFDCHHCCHCHTPTGAYIIGSEDSPKLRENNTRPIMKNTSLFSLRITPKHRPPIS